MVGDYVQDDFVRRIAIYLLNSLACQVDGKFKQLVGDLGAIEVSLTDLRLCFNGSEEFHVVIGLRNGVKILQLPLLVLRLPMMKKLKIV